MNSVVDKVVNGIKSGNKSRVRRKPPQKKVNEVAIVIDSSTSMNRFTNKMRSILKSLVSNVYNESAASGQKTNVHLYYFSDTVSTPLVNPLIENISYHSYGNTALWEAIGTAITDLSNIKHKSNEDVSYLVTTLTDGENNRDLRYDEYTLGQMINQKDQLDNWTFVYQVPPGKKEALIRNLHLDNGENVVEWEATEAALDCFEKTSSLGFNNYLTSRSMGLKKSNEYFKNIDLSGLTTKAVVTNLNDVSDRFKVLDVTKGEIEIRDFIESHTRRPYVVGSAYYQLTKQEVVQPSKQVLVVEKGKKAIWAGKEARDLIGLPYDRSVKVNPFNLSKYDVFVASTSVNRKLVRGTKVLFDFLKKKGDKPTWNHLDI